MAIDHLFVSAEYKEIIISLIVALIGILIWYLKHEYGEKRTLLPNGQVLVRPARLPFVGFALGLSPENFIERLEDYYRRYGDFMEIYLGPNKLILITDTEISKEILNLRPKIFRRVRSLDYPGEQLGYLHTVFFAHGNDWNVARRLTSPSFNKENVACQIIGIWQMGQRWARDIEAVSFSQPVMEFKTEALEFTLRVITKIVFGIDRETDKESYFNQPIFAKDFQAAFSFLMESIIFPFPRILWKLSPWHYGKYEAPATEGDERFRQACSELIAEQKKRLFGPNASTVSSSANTTLLSTLLKKAERDQISDNDVMANAKLFFLAGSETTSIGISFAIYYLALHPDIRDIVREEVDRFALLMEDYCAQQNNSSPDVAKRDHPDIYETVFTQLTWTEAVFKESLRLQPPATFIGLTPENDTTSYTLPNGITIGPKDEVGIYVEAMLHYCEKNYDDAHLFKPSRWLDPDPVKREKAEQHFTVFGGGPRVCPGMKLAMIEGILAVAALVQHLDWTLACDPSEIKRLLLVSSTPNKMPLRITPRAKK